jgi:hypothetical protein
MDDKELVKRVKNSFKAKKSMAEVLQGFQRRGYKLAYADKLISKAKRPRKVMVFSLLSIIIVFLIAMTSYSIFFDNHKMDLTNPLAGLSFVTGNAVANPEGSTTQVSIDEIEITPEFISYLLNEVGAWKLHKNPLTFEKPVINFKIDGEEFSSEISREIKSKRGLNENADLQFNGNKRDVIEALMNENPEAVFKNSLTNGKTQVEIFASQPELLAKGYLSLYDSLK